MSEGNEARRITEYSVCGDGEPLVTSLEVRGHEWLCMVCGRRYPMFRPGSRPATPELDARYEELRALYRAGERPPVEAAR